MNNRKIKRTPYGQWKYPHEPTVVPTPTGKITMQGLDYPVLGIDNLGNSEMMMPGNNYQFPGNEVLELPVNKFQKGGPLSNVNLVNNVNTNLLPASNRRIFYNKQEQPLFNPIYITPSSSTATALNNRRSPLEVERQIKKQEELQRFNEINERQKNTKVKSKNELSDYEKRIGTALSVGTAGAGLYGAGAAVLPFLNAPAVIGNTTIPWLTGNNLLWGAGAALSGNEILNPNSATRTSINEAIDNPNLYSVSDAVGNAGLTALGFAGLPYKQGFRSLINDARQVGNYFTQGPLKNAYNLNPRALKNNDVEFLWRWQADNIPQALTQANAVPSQYTNRWFKKGLPEDVLEYLKIRPGSGTLKGIAMPKGTSTLPEDAAKFTFSNKLREVERIIPDELLNKTTNFRIENNPWLLNNVDNPNFLNDFNNLGNIFKNARIKPHWWKGYSSTPKQLSGSGNNLVNYLTTQTPLKNAYKYNPNALKENPNMFLYRAEPTDFDTRNTVKILQEKLANNEGNAIQQSRWKKYINEYNQGHPRLVAQNDFHGQWLEKDPVRLDWYLHSGDKVDIGTPMSIFRTKIPTSQSAQYNVGNIKKANFISSSPKTEFVIPRNIIEQGEKFPESSWKQLIQEDKAFNTPHWWRGYGSNTPKQLPGSGKFKSEIDWSKWNPETPNYPELINEYNAIEESTKKAGTWMKNPDGSDFKGTPEQFVQQKSSWFKKAFGNSKLVNLDGSPTFHYHGTKNPLKDDKFNLDYFGTSTDNGWLGKGIYITPKKYIARNYSKNQGHITDKSRIYELYADVKNPISTGEVNRNNLEKFFGREDDVFFKNNDAVIDDFMGVPGFNSRKKDLQEILIKNPQQLKSAIGNVGFFDMTNPNIYKGLIPAAIGAGAIKENKKYGGRIKFQKGSQLPPIYVDPNDSAGRARYQAYQDSLYNYNYAINLMSKDFPFANDKQKDFYFDKYLELPEVDSYNINNPETIKSNKYINKNSSQKPDYIINRKWTTDLDKNDINYRKDKQTVEYLGYSYPKIDVKIANTPETLIKAKQQQLIDAGYNIGKADGIWGNKSKAAWEQYQNSLNTQNVNSLGLNTNTPELQQTVPTQNQQRLILIQTPDGKHLKVTPNEYNNMINKGGSRSNATYYLNNKAGEGIKYKYGGKIKRIKFDTGGDLINDKNSLKPQLHYYKNNKDNSLKGLNANQLANLRSSDFESEEDYVSYLNSGASYNCGKNNCALYAHDRAGELIGLTGRDYVRWVGDGKYTIGVSGNAWQNLGNIEEFGGQTIYRKDKNQQFNPSQVRIGDIVGLGSGRVTPRNNRYNTSGVNAPKAGATNSHTGIVEYIDKDGNIYVRHNIRGNTSVQKIVPSSKGHTLEGSSTWDIFSVARPNYESYKPAPITIDPETNSPKVTPFESDYNPDSFVKFIDPNYATLPKVDEKNRPIRKSYQPNTTFPRTVKDVLGVPNLKNATLNDVLNTPVQYPISEKSGNPAMQEFYDSLYNNKEKLMQYFRMTNEDFNKYAALALATVAAETEFGTNKRQKYKEAFPAFTRLIKSFKDGTNYSQNEMSVGLGQVKPYSTSNFFKREFGITNKSMRNPAHNALAVFEHLVTDSENAKRWAEDNNQEYPQEINEDYKKLGAVAYVNPRLIRAGNLTFNESFNKPDELNNTNQFNLNSADNARLRYINHILPQIHHYDENTIFRGNRLNEFTVTPNNNEESIETNKKYGGKIKYQNGGEFENFVNTLPDNLRYSGPDYNLRGMWKAAGSPKSFLDVKDTEYFPLQDDGLYHGFGRDDEGNWLKSKQHPTAWMEALYGYQLTPEVYNNYNIIYNPKGHFRENQLQYVPMKKYGGKIKYQSGGNFNTKVGFGKEYTPLEGFGSFSYGVLQGAVGTIPGIGTALTPALEAGRKGLQTMAGNANHTGDNVLAGSGEIVGAIGTGYLTGNPIGAVKSAKSGLNKITSQIDTDENAIPSESSDSKAEINKINNIFDTGLNFDMIPMFKTGGNMTNMKKRINYYQMGGNMGLTEYEGLSHDEGGLPIPGRNAEVEGGETMINDYVFSDSLQVPGKKKTFAQESKAIKNKYNLRKGDPLSQQMVNEELEELMMLQESLKKDMASEKMNEALELDPTILDSMMQGDPSMQQGMLQEMPQSMPQGMPMGSEGMMPMEGMPMMNYGGKLKKYQNGDFLEPSGQQNLNTILNNVAPGFYQGQEVIDQNKVYLPQNNSNKVVSLKRLSLNPANLPQNNSNFVTPDYFPSDTNSNAQFTGNQNLNPVNLFNYENNNFDDDDYNIQERIYMPAVGRELFEAYNNPKQEKVNNKNNFFKKEQPNISSEIDIDEFELNKLPMRIAQGLNAVGPIANFAAAAAARQPRLTRNQDFIPVSSRPAEMLLESANNRALATGRDSFRSSAPNQQSFMSNTLGATSKISEDIGKGIADLRFRNDLTNIKNRQNIDAINIANQTANNLLLDQSDANRWNLALQGVQGLQEGMQQGLMDEMKMDNDLLKIMLGNTANYKYKVDNKKIKKTYINNRK